MESHLEARLWNDVFVRAQRELGIPNGTIRATVLIETILAAFEMHEILYELRDHSAGLNCGRWDYIFSFIKKFRARPRLHHARPRRDHDGQGVPRRVRRSADPDLPSPRHSRDGRDGGADSDQERCRGERRGDGESARPTSCAKCAPGTTGRGSRIRGSCRSRRRSSTSTCRARIRSSRTREDVQRHTRPDLAARARRARSRRRGAGRTSTSASSTSRRGSAASVRAAVQPDGRRGDRGDLAHAAVAVDPSRRDSSTTAARSTPELYRSIRDEELQSIGIAAAHVEQARGAHLRRADSQRRARRLPDDPGLRRTSSNTEETE